MLQLFDKLIGRLRNQITDAKASFLEETDQFEIDLMLPNFKPGLNAQWKSMVFFKLNVLFKKLLKMN